MSPIGIISDTHYHNFTQYAQIDEHGRNTRLMDTLRATGEAVQALRKVGGKTLIHAGDVFHVRGNINPTVLNPVLDFYRKIVESGIEVFMISGNHDLESNDASDLSSTVTALRDVGVKVINKDIWYKIGDEAWAFIPWTNSLDELRTKIKAKELKDENPCELIACRNLVIHAPMNGVIEGLPDHGLTTKDFDGSIWNNVFIGHYHNHKHFTANDGDTAIYSVGALTHQNWGDTQARAGYMIYHPVKFGHAEQFETAAPKFVKVEFEDLDMATNIADNYIKVVGGKFTNPADIEAVRNELILRGAKAVIVEGFAKRPAVTRTGVASSSAPTLQSILGDYIDRNYPGDAATKTLALEMIGEVYD